MIVWVVPGAAYALMSKFYGVNAVVWVATTRPSTDSVAWWLTAPNSIHVDCGCPESGTVMLREYTASFTSVKPCLYQPPPGTAIEVAARPAGVKLHVPAQVDRGDRGVTGRHTVSTGGRHAPLEPGAARAGPWIARVRPRRPRLRPALQPLPATSRAGGRSNDACQPPVTHPQLRNTGSGHSLKADTRTVSTNLPASPTTWKGGLRPGYVRYVLTGVSSVKSTFQDGYFLLLTPRRLRVAADEYDPSGVLGIALRHSVSPAPHNGADRRGEQIAYSDRTPSLTRRRCGRHCDPRRSRRAARPDLFGSKLGFAYAACA